MKAESSDLVSKTTRVTIRYNTRQHDTRQHEHNTTQHETTQVQHETTRV